MDFVGVLERIPDTNIAMLVFGIGSVALMIFLKKAYPKFPGVLFAVIIAIMASRLISFEDGYGGKVVGRIPEGLPKISWVRLKWELI